MNRARKIARQHTNGDAKRHAHLQTTTSVVVDELIAVTGPARQANEALPVAIVCDLTEDCARFVTHEVPVRVDGKDGTVFGCAAHAVAWAAEATADGATEGDDGAE